MVSQELSTELRRWVEDPELGLRFILSQIGSVAVVGSYDLGLIHPDNPRPDVDMNLLVEPGADLVPLAASIGIGLVSDQRLPWHKFEVYDNRKADRLTLPNSVYLGSKGYVSDGKVVADVWLFDDKTTFDLAYKKHAYIKEALTPKAAETILAIKKECLDHGIYIPGSALSRAVLDYGVTTADEYLGLDPVTKEGLAAYKFIKDLPDKPGYSSIIAGR